MKTKLATLLIAPALLFTACGAKEISFKEAYDFIKEHYTLKEYEATAKKISATWDFKFEETEEKTQKFIVKTFFSSLVGSDLANAEVNTISGSFTDKSGTSMIMNDSNFDYINSLYLIGSKLTLSGNELSVFGPAFREGFFIKDLKFTFNDKGVAREVHGVIEKQEINKKASFSEDKQSTIEGKLDITFSDFVYPNL